MTLPYSIQFTQPTDHAVYRPNSLQAIAPPDRTANHEICRRNKASRPYILQTAWADPGFWIEGGGRIDEKSASSR